MKRATFGHYQNITRLVYDLTKHINTSVEWGAAWHRRSVRASHPAAPGLNPGSAEVCFLLLSLWTVDKLNHQLLRQGIL